MNANLAYRNCLFAIDSEGDIKTTRNAITKYEINLPVLEFTETPLVGIRKTAWKKAIEEMEWFFSGSSLCPENLRDWWAGQLNENNHLIHGYPKQFRFSSYFDKYGKEKTFDQIAFLYHGLINNINSRRLSITSWNPGEMAHITDTNDNILTPTCCHTIYDQFFLYKGKLVLKTLQRSADMLLGVPHNWIQKWAVLLYFAYHSGLEPGSLLYIFNDAHIYQEESHIETVKQILELPAYEVSKLERPILVYDPKNIEFDSKGVPIFKVSDFRMEGTIPESLVSIRPKLL